MVFFLAIRNIVKNKKDSAVVLILIGVITFLFFIGNSIIAQAGQGIRRAFIESLTGDVILQKTGDVTMNLFGANAPIVDEFFTIPVFPAYDAVMEIVKAEQGVAGITSQVSGRAFLDLLNVREPVLLGGVDAETYFPLFPGIILEEGRFLEPGEQGAMITEERAQRIESRRGQRPQLGMPMLLTSGGASGFKIREVPLIGIFSYQNPGQFMNEIVITDPQTVRILNSIQVAGVSEVDNDSFDFLWADMDDIFDGFFEFHDDASDLEFSPAMLEHFLSEIPDTGSDETGGDWNFIILRLHSGVSPGSFISSLNTKIEPYGVSAVNWRIAAGTSAILLLLIQALFNAGIFFVSVVGIIAMVNIFLISVFRRVREIGTLRAIGASDSYIRSLIYSENLIISLLAGLAGIFSGALFVHWLNSLDLYIYNELLTSLLNSQVLYLDFSPVIAFASIGVSVLLGIIAAVYPVETAVRLEPMAAVRRG